MPEWLVKILAAIYTKIPPKSRPPIKKVFYFVLIRIQALFLRRRILKGNRVAFVDFEIADLEKFEFLSPGKDEILVECHQSTVSPGTENAVLCGMPGARKDFPYYPGYSAAGVVKKAGKDIKKHKVGDRVVGRIHHMSHETFIPKFIFKIPDGVDFVQASFMELGIITLQGIRKAGITPGDRVAVLGQGLIGQLSNKLAKILGASEVIAIASSRSREITALTEDGAEKYISIKEYPEIVHSVQADIVIEAVGFPQAVITALQCTKPGGKVILLGSSRGIGRGVNWKDLAQSRNIRVIGAHITDIPDYDASFQRWTYFQEGELFLSLLNSGKLDVKNLVSWHAEPEECNAVYETLSSGGKNHVGIVFNWKN